MGILRQIYIRMTGEQQLLNENKERSGDTRAIRQNRTHRHGEADKQVTPAPTKLGGPPAVKTADEDESRRRSSRVNNSSREEELSAQRRKKKKFSVFGLSNPDPMELEPRIGVNTPWTATASEWVGLEDINGFDIFFRDYQQQRTNSYTVIPSQTWAPSFAKEASNNRTYINSPTHELGATTFRFNWTFYQSNYQLDGLTVRASVVATLPQLPEPPSTWFTNHPRVSLKHLPSIASSDGRYIWYSTVYALSRPSYNFYYSYTNRSVPDVSMQAHGNENRFYDFQNGGVFVREIVSRRTQNYYPASLDPMTDAFSDWNYDYYNSDNYKRYAGWDFLIKPLNDTTPNIWSQVQAYALTWRYDTQNPQSPPNFSTHNLGYTGDGTVAGLHNFASMYLGLLDANHPAKEEWTKMLALKTANESFAALANRYFDPTYGPGFYSLVAGLVYYKDTGLAIYTGKLKRGASFPNFPRVYTKTLTPNLSYSSASYRMPYPSSTPGSYFKEYLTTHEDMIAAGWEEQADAPVTQFGTALPYYFTHRPT